MAGRPKNFAELFDFYHKYVKLLYSSVQSDNALPIELLFELNAALDHLSRHWAYNETEEQVVQKAYAHFKRACLDVFKIRLKLALDQYERINAIDTSIVDNGEFDKRLHSLVCEIKTEATEARRLEGNSHDDDDQTIIAFDRWEPVFRKCVELEQKFLLHEHLDWARKKQVRQEKQFSKKSFILGVISSFVAGVLFTLATWACHSAYSWCKPAKPTPSISTPIE